MTPADFSGIDLDVPWHHSGFGTHVARLGGTWLLVRVARRGRVPVAYVATVGSWHSRSVPFGDDRAAALQEAKSLAVNHIIGWGPADPTDPMPECGS